MKKEPIQETCSRIDEQKSDIKHLRDVLSSIDSEQLCENIDKVEALLWDIGALLREVDDFAEEMREANRTLRFWGLDLVNELERVEKESEDKSLQIVLLQDKISEIKIDFQFEIEDLKEEIDGLTNRLDRYES